MKQLVISLLIVFVVTNTFVTSVFADNEPIACDGVVRNYVSATGTVIQNGTPTPENPIEPIFYTQGDMILRAVGDYADSYDATTGKITRRVGVKVLDGTETIQYTDDWNCFYFSPRPSMIYSPSTMKSSHFNKIYYRPTDVDGIGFIYYYDIFIRMQQFNGDISLFKSYLAQQYANGTPLTVYYPLATEVVEDWSATTYCGEPIKIATTKFVDEEFKAAEDQLAATVQTIESVVSRTIAQTGQIATLQETKQTRPDESCPANMKCLLVQDEDGTPHWYPIIEP
ncbi:MAG: hypothetical protein KBT14_00145 [Proteobacteria bacterium]|nr:hypothetical protein [Candidatus Enterousia onthequi]